MMADKTVWQVLYIDDDVDNLRQVKELLDGEGFGDGTLLVTTSNDFSRALNLIASHRYDLVMLDLRLGPLSDYVEEEAGAVTLKAIQTKQFIPVIFYTALPKLVGHLESPLVKVVEKTRGAQLLPIAIKDVFDTLLPVINRALINHIETIQRDYMWDFVAKNWEQLSNSPDHSALAYLLARRLAISLSEKGIENLILSLGGTVGLQKNGIHPMQYYVMPPVEADPLAGDIFHGTIGDKDGYWVLLTPSCDLVTGRDNAEFSLFAQCKPLMEHEEYKRWKSNPEKNKENFERFIGNRKKERFYYLPSALSIPDLVIDLQALVTVPLNYLSTLKRIASMDSPYAEGLLIRFSRYFGRIGVRDLDVNITLSRLP